MVNLYSRYYSTIWKSIGDEEFLQEVLDQYDGGGTLVDLGCATGRILKVASRENWQTIGIDNDPDMIKIAKAECSNLKNLELICENFIGIEKLSGIEVISVMANTYALIVDPEERRNLLNACHPALAEHGTFLVWILSGLNKYDQPKEVTFDVAEGQLIYRANTQVVSEQSLRKIDFEFEINEERQCLRLDTRIFKFGEIESEFEACGFNIVEAYGDFAGNCLDDQSVFQIYKLRKKSS